MDSTLFFALGIGLVALALIVSAIGLRSESFPSNTAMGVGIMLFALMVGATTTFAVLNSKNEQKDRQAKIAEEIKKEGGTKVPGGGTVPTPDAGAFGVPVSGGSGAGGSSPSNANANTTSAAPAKGAPKAKGPGGTLALSADPTQLAFDKTALASKPGKITINLDNPAQIPHSIAVKDGSTLVGESKQVAQSKTSVTVDLPPGKYEFLCTVPGHEQAGMKGTLTVK